MHSMHIPYMRINIISIRYDTVYGNFRSSTRNNNTKVRATALNWQRVMPLLWILLKQRVMPLLWILITTLWSCYKTYNTATMMMFAQYVNR